MGHSYTSVGTCLRRSNNGRSLARRLTVGVGEVEVGNLPASKDPGCICSCCVIIILKFQVLGGGQRGALRMSRTKSVRSRVRSPYDAAYDVAPCRSYGVVRCRTKPVRLSYGASSYAGSFVVRGPYEVGFVRDIRRAPLSWGIFHYTRSASMFLLLYMPRT